MKHKYYKFLEHAGNEDTPYYAIEAIKEFAEANEPIPQDLLYYLRQACNQYQGQMGNRVSNPVTAEQIIRKVATVEILKDAGFSVKDAIKRAVEGTSYKASSLRTEYYNTNRESLEVTIAKSDLLNEWLSKR